MSIVLYELNKYRNKKSNNEILPFNLASSKQVNDSFLEIEEMLIRIGYLLKHTSYAKVNAFKSISTGPKLQVMKLMS